MKKFLVIFSILLLLISLFTVTFAFTEHASVFKIGKRSLDSTLAKNTPASVPLPIAGNLQQNVCDTTLSMAKGGSCSFQTTAKACVVMERNSRRILFENNANEHLPMSSTTKIVTALTVINHANLDDVVTIPQKACGIEGSSVYLRVGEN